MAKLKSFAFALGILLLVGAVVNLYSCWQNISSIRPASAYEDKGVHTFVPYKVYSKKKNTILPAATNIISTPQQYTLYNIWPMMGANISTNTK